MMNCPACRNGNCEKCPDRIMLLLGKDTVCTCGKSGHEDAIAGDARRNQVEDPFTGDVHGPGIRVTQEGVVERTESSSPASDERGRSGQ